VRKALLVVHNLVNAWSFCQLIHQMLNAQYGRLKVQCILAQMCNCYLKLSKFTTYPPQNYLHRTISQINEVSKLLVVIHWELPLLKFSMSLIYHMILNSFYSHPNKSWFIGNNNLVSMIILLTCTTIIPQGIKPQATHLKI
jgi:hypothetical protein